jgi:hypothetical protein
MIPEEDFLDTRSITAPHKNKIHFSFNHPDREFQELIKRIYSHHEPTIFNNIGPYPLKPSCYEKWPDLPCKEHLSAYFYQKIYKSPTLRESDSDGSVLTDSEFISEVIVNAEGNRTNRINFLSGSIGSGKSSFINYLITKYGLSF